MSLSITPLLLLEDNYGYILIDKTTGQVAVVDPSESKPVIQYLESNNLNLDFIINTHHHWDHIGGNEDLKNKYNAKIVAPSYDVHRIPNVEIPVSDNDIFHLGGSECVILHVPGHTLGQVALWFKKEEALFTGDTVFSLGCGRLFEGTAEQMLNSFKRIRALPLSTKIYFGHEYTAANLKFALSIDSKNKKLQAKPAPTTPTRLAEEIEQSPFFRWDDPCLRKNLNMTTASDVQVFAKIRSLKDDF